MEITGNRSNCSSSVEEKTTKSSSDGASKTTDVETTDFSTKVNLSVNANFCPVSKKSYRKGNEKSKGKLTKHLSIPEVAAQPVHESRSLIDKVSKSIESTKDANPVLGPSESNSNFIKSRNRRSNSNLASGKFAIKRRADNNTSSASEKSYKSDKCKEKSLNQTSFIRSHKPHSSQNLIVCGDSQNVISHEDLLERNKRTHTLEKEFACNKFEKRFTHNRLLNKNDQIYNNKRPFECDKCKKAFKRKDHLTRHYRIHSNEKPYVCNTCGKGFVQQNSLVVHERTHTGEKPYECKMCEKRFNIKSNLTVHERTHTGEKPYGCGICKKRFRDQSNLSKHKRTHTNEKPFGCALCEIRFKNRRYLMLHRRKHKVKKP